MGNEDDIISFMKAKRLFFILFIISAALIVFSVNKADPDLWGHLKYGQDTFERHSVLRYDIYSYSVNGAPWINHEWLSELIFYVVFRFLGSAGLLALKVFLGSIILCFLYRQVTKSTGSFPLQVLLITLFLLNIWHGFIIRPQIFTYLFFTILAILLKSFDDTVDPKRLYPLPVIFLFWCNLHGGFFAGLGLFFLYVLIKLFKKESSKELLFIFLLSFAVTLVNPYGVGLWGFILKAAFMQRPFITEWQRVAFSLRNINYFIILVLAIIGLILSRIKRSTFEVIVVLTAIFLSFHHVRHIPLCAILFTIYMPKYIDSFSGKWAARLENKIPQRFFVYAFALISSLWLTWEFSVKKVNPLEIEVREDVYPTHAVKFIKDNALKGNIFCWFDWAQMCIRELPDTNKVFFDGRYETVYSDEIIKNYFDIVYSVRKDYKQYLSRFPETDIMCFGAERPIARLLLKDDEWVKVYSAGGVLIFLKKNEKNKIVIENFLDHKLKYPQRRAITYFK